MPLILSMVSTAYEDLRTVHQHLDAFVSAAPSAVKVREAQKFF